MKKNRKLLGIFLAAMMLLTGIFGGTLNVAAAQNPYGEWQTIGGVTTRRCTWYAWKMAYERTGTALPGLGNGGQWYDNAKKYGYSVGTVAAPNSLAVWKDSGYGHVAFVESVSNGKMHVLEGGRSDLANNGSGGVGSANVGSAVGSLRNYGKQKLQGFIYLNQTFNVSYEALGVSSVTGANAQLNAYIRNPNRLNISHVGAYLWDSTGRLIKTHKEACGLTYTRFQQGFNVQKEGGVTLKPGATYTCQFYAVSGNKVAYSAKKTFQTTPEKKPVVMGKSTITSVKSNAAGALTIYWNRLDRPSGYQLRIAKNAKFSGAKTYNLKATSIGATVSKLTKGSIYFVQVRGYWTENGKTKYNAWSPVKLGVTRIW